MFLKKVGRVFYAIWRFLRSCGLFIYTFRGFFMAIPVVLAALYLAKENMAILPEQVGLVLAKDGTFSAVVARAHAVQWPLYITGGSVILMWLSRKAFFPWLMSVVTLIIPIYIRLLNQFF